MQYLTKFLSRKFLVAVLAVVGGLIVALGGSSEAVEGVAGMVEAYPEHAASIAIATDIASKLAGGLIAILGVLGYQKAEGAIDKARVEAAAHKVDSP